ncbi:MAG: Ig-like domain-containing protein [Clostridiales bacterium]|nr:Ig-like domain-containing protein [Clostridiales bacterium]
MITNLDFNTVIEGERSNHLRNFTTKTSMDTRLNYTSYGSCYSCNCASCTTESEYIVAEKPNWHSMSSASLAYYINPLNFLDERYIFMFEYLGYDANFQTIDGVKKILSGTFMSSESNVTYLDSNGNTQTLNKNYAQIIMEAAEQAKVSPYYLAARIKQEVGVSGSSSTSGNYLTYKGIYNFYNIHAYSSASDSIASGLSYAANLESGYQTGTYGRPWTTPEKSIVGGALWIADGYINEGQNTLYLQKFDLIGDLYTHQYMTNAHAPANEASTTYDGYMKNSELSEPKVFYIPVFKNIYSSYDDNNILKKYNISLDKLSDKTLNNPTGTVVVTASPYTVRLRTGPGISYNQFVYNPSNMTSVKSSDYVSVPNGTSVTVKEQIYTGNSSFPLWYHIEYTKDNITFDGWLPSSFVSLTPSAVLTIGEQATLTATPSISTDTDLKAVTFSSSDTSVATVNSTNGTLNALKAGTTIITATARTGQTDSFVLQVSAEQASVSKIEFSQQPTLTTFTKGDSFKTNGKIKVTYSTGNFSYQPITEDMCYGYDMQSVSEQEICVEYMGKSLYYTIEVNDTPEITQTPEQYYQEGNSTLDKSGEVSYTRADGTTQTLNLNDGSFTFSGYNLNNAGKQTVTATNGEITITYTIYVTINITINLPQKIYYAKGSDLSTNGGYLRLYYSDTLYEDIPIDLSLCSGFDSSSEQTNQTITIHCNNIAQQTYNINIYNVVVGNIDSSADNTVNMLDCMYFLKYLKEGKDYSSPEDIAVADFNFDGNVTMSDVLGLFKYCSIGEK